MGRGKINIIYFGFFRFFNPQATIQSIFGNLGRRFFLIELEPNFEGGFGSTQKFSKLEK